MILRPFNSISIISARWVDDNEGLRAMLPHLQLEIIPTPAWIELKTARSADQRLTY